MITLSRFWSAIRIVLVLAVMLLGLNSNPARAAGPWYVTTGGNDSNDCLSPASPCATINAAIGKATSGDTIYVATGTYTGSGNEVVLVDRSITLSGGWDATFTSQGANSTIDGGDARRGILVNASLTVNIERFTVQHGSIGDYGGGIRNYGTLNLNNSFITANNQGGIYNSGSLTINNSTVTSNTTNWNYSAGGIYSSDTLIINSSTINGNWNTSYSSGGGIEGTGNLTVNNTSVNNNIGIGIEFYNGTITVNNVTVNDTMAMAGIVLIDATANVSNSTVNGNADGGVEILGMHNATTINNSTVSNNSRRAGIFMRDGATAIVNNSTISDNTAGGIYLTDTSKSITINNSTIAGNSAPSGGGIFNGGVIVNLRNSILAGNTSSGPGPDCYGAITSAGYNLIGNTANCTFTGDTTGNLTGVDPMLGPLQAHGGPTLTRQLLPGSPAINAGNPAGCTDHLGNPLNTDQRGASRIGRCDMGAFEYTPPGPAARIVALEGTPQSTPPLMPFLIPLKVEVLDSIGISVNNAEVTFTAPQSGASGTFADTGTITSTGMSNERGVVTAATFTANNITGSYQVTASVSGVITPTIFSLTNGWWYVTTAGNDSNNCASPATPCATINGALGKDTFASGSTIFVASGTYTSSSGNEVVLLNKSATLSGGWDAAFTSQTGMSTIDGGGARRGITINSTLIVNIERFVIQNSGGRGINNEGNLTLNNSTVSGNGGGPGIYSGGSLSLNNSTIIGNTNNAYSSAGGIQAYGTLSISNSTLSNNIGFGLQFLNGVMTMNNVTVNSNSPHYGITLVNVTAVLSNSTVNGNANGGIEIVGGTTTATLNNITVSNNSIRAGIVMRDGATAIVNNSTISDNPGGGIFLYDNTTSITLNNSTIAGNTKPAGSVGGGIFNGGRTVTLRNSILAGNTSSGPGPDCYGTITSAGYNLIANTANCIISGDTTGNITGMDARLGPLQDNGGAMLTRQLLQGSPAINAGNPAGCTDHLGNPLTTDQRGKPRFGRCDMGAYELQPLGFSNKLTDRQISHPGETISYTITLDNPGTTELTGVQLTDTLPKNLGYVDGSLSASKGQASYLNGVISWSGTLAAQEQVDVAFSATVSGSAPLYQPITNTAEILGGGEAFLRRSAVQIEPYLVYVPFISKPCFPLYSDDFSNPASGWPVGDNGNYRYEYLNGEYRVLVRPAQGGAGASPGFQASDYSVSVNLRNQNALAGSYGIAFGVAGDWSSFYTLEIYPDGWYGIYRYDPSEVITLAEAFSPAIYQGTASNLIKVERVGASINAYANGQLLASLTDGTYTGTRYLGLIVWSYNQPNVDIRFDNFTVYPSTCPGTTAALSDESTGSTLPIQRMFDTNSVEKGHSESKTGR